MTRSPANLRGFRERAVWLHERKSTMTEKQILLTAGVWIRVVTIDNRWLGNWRSLERSDVAFELRPDRRNRYDANAVFVVLEGKPLGYLPRKVASSTRRPLENLRRLGKQVFCVGRVVSATEQFALISRPSESELLERLAAASSE
jgi:hypothetical protein